MCTEMASAAAISFSLAPAVNRSRLILGGGLPLFGKPEKRARLELRSSKTFGSGVIAVHYLTKR